ncbi:PapD-like protein [Trichoderma novae-zelandiae]
MSVEIEPLELSFRRPFTVEVSQILKIKNPSSSPLAFKVKTTAPKQYCVRPNAGRIEPGQDFDVTVLLQAMKSDPPLDAKCRDKFLVQSAPITADKEFASIASVLESTDKASISERKIRVNWLPAGDSPDSGPTAISTPIKQTAVNGSYETPEPTRAYSSPSGGDSSNSAPPPYVHEINDDDDSRPQTAKSAASKTASAVASTVQTGVEEFKAKIAQLEAELANYKNSGLRQRNVKAGESEKSSGAALAQQTKQVVEGVPVKIVAILCLVSFLLAYVFF